MVAQPQAAIAQVTMDTIVPARNRSQPIRVTATLVCIPCPSGRKLRSETTLREH